MPGDVSLWPNLSGGETIDLLLRMRGPRARRHPARGAAGAASARPDQEGPRLLQGQPAEGGAGRGVRRARRPAGPRRADLRARPADGAGLQRASRRAHGGRHDGPAVQPHPQRGGAAGRPGHDHPRGPHRGERARLDELRHLRRNRVRAEVVGPGARPVHDPRRPRRRHRRPGRQLHGRPRGAAAVLSALHEAGVVSLTSTPPTLEELFLDAYRGASPSSDRLRGTGLLVRLRAPPATGCWSRRGWSSWPRWLRQAAAHRSASTRTVRDRVVAAEADQRQPGDRRALRPDPRHHAASASWR